MEDIESQFKSQFCLTANTLTQFYMNGLQLNKKAYNTGVKKTVDKITQFLLSHNTSDNKVISIDLVLSFLDIIQQEVSAEEKGKAVISSHYEPRNVHCSTSGVNDNDEPSYAVASVNQTTSSSPSSSTSSSGASSIPTNGSNHMNTSPSCSTLPLSSHRAAITQISHQQRPYQHPPVNASQPQVSSSHSANVPSSQASTPPGNSSNNFVQQMDNNPFNSFRFKNPFAVSADNSTNVNDTSSNSGSSSSPINDNGNNNNNSFIFGTEATAGPLFTFQRDITANLNQTRHSSHMQEQQFSSQQEQLISSSYSTENPLKRNISDVLMGEGWIPSAFSFDFSALQHDSSFTANKRSRTTVFN